MNEKDDTLEKLREQRRRVLTNTLNLARESRDRALAQGNARQVLRCDGMILRGEQALAALEREHGDREAMNALPIPSVAADVPYPLAEPHSIHDKT